MPMLKTPLSVIDALKLTANLSDIGISLVILQTDLNLQSLYNGCWVDLNSYFVEDSVSINQRTVITRGANRSTQPARVVVAQQ